MNILMKKINKWIANLLTPSTHNYKKWDDKNCFLRKAGINIGKNVAIDRGFFCLDSCEENIKIDDYSAIGINTKIWAFNKVYIGKFCMFAGEVNISNGGHDTTTLEPYSSEIQIGNGAWIGHRVTIVSKQAGLTIGNNAIVGAGSLILNDVPENAIVAGVPARVIRYRELPEKVWHIGNEYFCPKTFQIVKEEK